MEEEKERIKIVILQRGWVVIGRYYSNGTISWIEGGAVIRRWGTESGLGQLCLVGPTANTIVDPLGPRTQWHVLSEVGVLTMNETSHQMWEDRLYGD